VKFLTRLFGASKQRRLDHPVLGHALLMRAGKGAYWEIETTLDAHPFTLLIEAPDEAEPSPAQGAFFKRYAEDPALAFAKAQPLLVGEYEARTRQPFPADWTDAFEFVGMSVPVAADDTQPWELSFDCVADRARPMFTCSFEDGVPSRVQIDG